MDVAGKVAIVTGGAMGIGLAVARALAAAGAQLVVADRDSEAGKQAAGEVAGLFVRVDVSRDDELRRMIATAERFGGGVDILVNNAGGVEEPLFPEAPVEHWEQVLQVNLRAVMLATQLAVESMRRRRGTGRGNPPASPNRLHTSASPTDGFAAGAIVNVSSVAGLGVGPHEAPEYAAAKAGVVRFTAALSLLAAEGIRVNAICPDYVDTPAVRRSLAGISEQEQAAVPRLVAPETIANDVLGLVRDESLAGRVLVRFAEREPYLLGEGISH